MSSIVLHPENVLNISPNLHGCIIAPSISHSFYYRTAVIQSMAVSAASTIGGASATVAGATSAAIAGTATAAVATVSTATTVVSTPDH